MKQDTFVNAKLEIFVREFVNSDLCVNLKQDERVLGSTTYKFYLRNPFQDIKISRMHG